MGVNERHERLVLIVVTFTPHPAEFGRSGQYRTAVYVLGISALYHDAAAAVVQDGRVVAAVQEERFSRRKHDPSLPANAIEWCLSRPELAGDELAAVAYYDKPLSTFSRILHSYAAGGPRGLRTINTALSGWLRRKLWTAYEIEKLLDGLGVRLPGDVLFSEHHLSHAAAAFHPSPFERATILTIDGVGEWATTSIGHGIGRRVDLIEEVRFPNSLGLLYSAFTAHAGFKVNSGEYKLMGLAPYGEPRYVERIRENLIDVGPEGSYALNMRYFGFLAGDRMTNRRFDLLFDGPPRAPESPITRRECDLASSIQLVIEEVVVRMARHAYETVGERDLVMAGGVALNCVANGRLAREGIFDRIWVQPAAGDAGSAIGAATWAWHGVLGNDRRADPADGMSGALLGPEYRSDDVRAALDAAERPYVCLPDRGERNSRLADLLAEGEVVGVFQGRAEFGPRALGNRSILADPRRPDMQRTLNLRIKKRESFRPFAPAVLAEHAGEWFELDAESPYMLFTTQIARHHQGVVSQRSPGATIAERLSAVNSDIPAVTHVDGSARVQTVDATRSPQFHALLTAFYDLTGCPVVVNTSFNVRGEPIVNTPEEAYQCFMTTDMDWLLLEDCLLDRRAQPTWTGREVQWEPD